MLLLVGMNCRTGVALIGLSLSLGCGASYWKTQRDYAGDLQEVSASGQAAAKDEASKQAWLSCNALTVLLATRAQMVLDARAEDARGTAGAAKKLSDAEAAADLVRPLTIDACDLAKKIAGKLGTPAPVVAPALSPPATPAPAGVVMPSPALGGLAPSAPVGAPIQPTPPVVVPVPAVPQ